MSLNTIPSRKNRFDTGSIGLMFGLLLSASQPTYAQPLTPSIFCGAVHSYVCTPEQAIAEQRRQMQRRDPFASSEGQQAYARWFYLQQMQRQKIEPSLK